jgi:hypothetical protein
MVTGEGGEGEASRDYWLGDSRVVGARWMFKSLQSSLTRFVLALCVEINEYTYYQWSYRPLIATWEQASKK